MTRKFLRSSFAALFAVALVLSALSFWPSIREKETKLSKCQATVSSNCLTDLGIEVAMSSRIAPRYVDREVRMLADMGRISDAHSLALRVEEGKQGTFADAMAAADKLVASRRMTAAIREGKSLKEAIQQTPSVDLPALLATSRDFLPRNSFGHPERSYEHSDERARGIVRDIADEITARATGKTGFSQTWHLREAAEILAKLGHPSQAIDLLKQIPKSDDPSIHLPEELVRSIGVESALEIYQGVGGRRPNLFLTAASVEPDPKRATAYLSQAFDAFATETPSPDFDWMERTVLLSASLGYRDHALNLARQLAKKAQTEPYIFPVFPHINAARALISSDAPTTEARTSLELAESLFPENPQKAVGFGLVSGPILWGKSGLDAEARREIANLRARIGDLDITKRMMEGIDEPVISWTYMLTPEIPPRYLDELLDAASTALTPEELTYIHAQQAATIMRSDYSQEQKIWVLETTNDILEQKQFSGNRAKSIYTSIIRIAAHQQDRDIETDALDMLAQAALKTRLATDLIGAGFEWHQANVD